MEKNLAYGTVSALAAGGLIWGVMELWHILLGHGALVTNVGSIALGAVSAVGYYLFSQIDQLNLEFNEILAGAAFASVAVIHSAYWFLKPEVIGMGVTVAATAFLGTLVLFLTD